ncbi:LysR family transcriptional regulator [Marinobacter sp. 71-i]|uniref:LysR family transcriptional regulator n=1 Tax=Marinobacter iranensis TaxID=2962607 RepID=A0ABT5YAS4_9GAMM|nr:LysR family transcriptional regulator [Marinobacter iranensis]MDF0750744.1 LysR family transcriptional regulator [Marinobacter iranensis]
MDRLLEMQTFCAVVEAGSFVAASESMGVSKAAVSRYINELESRLGVRLLHRTTRRLSLTAEGEVFYVRCRELLAGVEEAESELTSRSGIAKGVLRVNAPVSFGIRHLAPLWGEFHALYPDVELNIDLSDRIVDIVEEGFDLAIRIASLRNSTLVSRRLTTTRLVVCASPEYLRAHGTPERPEDLVHHNVVAYSNLATGDDWHFQGPDGPVSRRVRPWMYANNGETCCAVAVAHQGVIHQPSFLVQDDLDAGRLVELMPGYRSAELGVYAVYPTRKFVTPKVRALVEFLVSAFPEVV